MAMLSPSGTPIEMLVVKGTVSTLQTQDAYAVVDLTNYQLAGENVGFHPLKGGSFSMASQVAGGPDVLMLTRKDNATVAIGEVHADLRQRLVAWIAQVNAAIPRQ